jgi:pilus assembly protein CpaD
MWWTDPAPEGLRRPVRGAALAAVVLAGAAACSPLSSSAPELSITPTEQYSIQVEEAPDQVAFTAHPDGLSLTQKAALTAFAGRWRQTPGAGDIVVETPAGPEAARAGGEILAALHAMGVPPARVRTSGYEGVPGAPVVTWFNRLEAKGPDCSGGWDNLTSTGSNGPSSHFGCAVTANLAAQIADPRDLLNPADTQPPDAARREAVLAKYRAGEVTSTARDEQAAGAVSRVVK